MYGFASQLTKSCRHRLGPVSITVLSLAISDARHQRPPVLRPGESCLTSLTSHRRLPLTLLTSLVQKTNKDSPKWYMPDVTFVARAAHLVPLSLLRTIASAGSAEAAGVSYIGKEGVEAIKGERTSFLAKGTLARWPIIPAVGGRGRLERLTTCRNGPHHSRTTERAAR